MIGFLVLLYNFIFLPSAGILLWKHKEEHGKVEYGEDIYNIGFTFCANSRQAVQRKLIKSDQEANTDENYQRCKTSVALLIDLLFKMENNPVSNCKNLLI